jgi:hypothetical protein
MPIAKGAQPPQKAGFVEERCFQVNQTLTTLYKDLNETWEKVEKKLRALVPPREAWFAFRTIDEDPRVGCGGYHHCLGLIKYRGEWRVCRGTYYDPQECEPDSWKPIVECSVADRVEAVEHIDALRDVILESAEKSIPAVTTAVSELAKALERI